MTQPVVKAHSLSARKQFCRVVARFYLAHSPICEVAVSPLPPVIHPHFSVIPNMAAPRIASVCFTVNLCYDNTVSWIHICLLIYFRFQHRFYSFNNFKSLNIQSQRGILVCLLWIYYGLYKLYTIVNTSNELINIVISIR